jgi:hypothetical protein
MALTANELHKDYYNDMTRKNMIYDMVYNKCCNKITVISYKKKDECIFVVQEFIIGVPKYNTEYCLCYIIKKLRENGFYVRYIPDNTLYISWRNDEQHKKITETRKFMKEERKKTKDIIPFLQGYINPVKRIEYNKIK